MKSIRRDPSHLAPSRFRLVLRWILRVIREWPSRQPETADDWLARQW